MLQPKPIPFNAKAANGKPWVNQFSQPRGPLHPAVFPIALPEFFIKLMTKEEDVVVDPFLGSGTTALAALRLGRQYIGIERNEGYVRLAESRIAAHLERFHDQKELAEIPV